MKNPILKSILRRPFKVLVIFLLLAATAFSFFSNITQSLVLNKELERLGSFYRSVGVLEELGEEDGELGEARQLIAQDPRLDFENAVSKSQGMMYDRVMVDFPFSEKFYFELEEHGMAHYANDHFFIGEIDYTSIGKFSKTAYDGMVLVTNVKEVLVGVPEHFSLTDVKGLLAHPKGLDGKGKVDFITNELIDDLMALPQGERYLFRGYYVAGEPSTHSHIKPLYPGGPFFKKIDNSESIPWKEDDWGKIKEEIEIINENIHSYEVHAIEDQANTPKVHPSQEYYYLVGQESRWLTREDHVNKNPVCLIREAFAVQRNIKIGDTLNMQFRNVEGISKYIVTEKDRKNWRKYELSEPVEFEVVGIFQSNYNMGDREIVIPKSMLPEEFADTSFSDKSYYYSFVLKSSQEEKAFLEDYQDKLNEMGYKLIFLDNGSAAYWGRAKQLQSSARSGVIVFTTLLFVSLFFSLVFFFMDQRRNYVLSRLLGVTHKHASGYLALVYLPIATFALLLGGGGGYYDALQKVTKQLEPFAKMTGGKVDVSIPVVQSLLMFLGPILVVILLFLLGNTYLKTRSLQNLLRGIHKQDKKSKKEDEVVDEEPILLEEDTAVKLKSLKPLSSAGTSVKELLLYTFRYAYRSKVGILLLAGVYALFIISMLWMKQNIYAQEKKMNEAYDGTEITATVDVELPSGMSSSEDDQDKALKGEAHIPQKLVDYFEKHKMVEKLTTQTKSVYEGLYRLADGKEELILEGKEVDGWFTTGYLVEAHSLGIGEGGFNLENLHFIEGYSEDDFLREREYAQEGRILFARDGEGKEFPIVASKAAMEKFGLNLGDLIALDVPQEKRRNERVYGKLIGSFSKKEDILMEGGGRIGTSDRGLFIYPLNALRLVETGPFYYQKLDLWFKKEMNREFLAKRQNLINVTRDASRDPYYLNLRIRDDELRKVVIPLEKSLDTAKIIYPVVLVISIFASALLCYLLLVKQRSQIALMQLLGMNKKDIYFSQVLGNVLLIELGILMGALLYFTVIPKKGVILPRDLLLFQAVYLFVSFIVIHMTIRKIISTKPLELLQEEIGKN